MPKITYAPREQDVIDAPDHYTIRVYLGPGRGWASADLETLAEAQDVWRSYVQLRPGGSRPTCYAVRRIAGEERLASLDTNGWSKDHASHH